ncbi:DUF2306 domain-containing protein [Noviherbaspirillum cavernae]|nr:DUF2306 domain-containing protein [Noviherbaspirillum cavernae]
MAFTPLILTHVLAASGALVIGGITLAMKKGTRTHRLFGRVWVALMFIAAAVSFGIQSKGHLSWIHLLSAWVLLLLGMSIYAVLKRNIKAHQRRMIGAYIGLIVAGAFSFLPNRQLGTLLLQTTGLI